MTGRAVGEALFRLDRLVDEMVELRKLLADIEAQEQGQSTPPRPRPPAVEHTRPEGMPAPTTYGVWRDRAATKDDLNMLRAVAKGTQPTPMTEADLDAMVQRRTGKARWNMLSKGEAQDIRTAIERGER